VNSVKVILNLLKAAVWIRVLKKRMKIWENVRPVGIAAVNSVEVRISVRPVRRLRASLRGSVWTVVHRLLSKKKKNVRLVLRTVHRVRMRKCV
jgi:hypothetical protein